MKYNIKYSDIKKLIKQELKSIINEDRILSHVIVSGKKPRGIHTWSGFKPLDEHLQLLAVDNNTNEKMKFVIEGLSRNERDPKKIVLGWQKSYGGEDNKLSWSIKECKTVGNVMKISLYKNISGQIRDVDLFINY